MTTYITNIGLLATPRGDSARRGRQQGEITLLRDAWVAVEGGKSPPWDRDSLSRRPATSFWTPEGG